MPCGALATGTEAPGRKSGEVTSTLNGRGLSARFAIVFRRTEAVLVTSGTRTVRTVGLADSTGAGTPLPK